MAGSEEQAGQSCLLLYDPATGEPQAMQIAVQRTLTLLFLRLAYVSLCALEEAAGRGRGRDS